MKKAISAITKNKIVFSAVSIVFGIILIIGQRAAVDSLVRILGIILLLGAASFAYLYSRDKDKYSSGIANAVVNGVIGLFFLLSPGAIVNFFPFIMGIFILISGLGDLGNALAMSDDNPRKIGFIVFSAIVIAVGVLAVFHPGAIADMIVLFIGISLVANGIFDIVMLRIGNSSENQ